MARGPEIERLYDEHAQALYAFLLNLTRDKADTRDLLQDVFVKIARDPELLAGVRDERAFLIRLAHNAAIDLMRRRGTRDKTREQFAAESISPFAPAGNPDEQTFRAALAGALAELPPDQCAVVHLKLWEGSDLRANRRGTGHPVQHGGQPLSLRARQIARAAASTL